MEPPEELRRVLDQHRSGGRLVFVFDYDCALASLLERPDLALLSQRTRTLLGSLAVQPRSTVALLSSRPLMDLMAMVRLPGLCYCGSGGLEFDLRGASLVHPDSETFLVDMTLLAAQVDREIGEVPGAWVERRALGFTVHHCWTAPGVVESVRERSARVLADHLHTLRVTEGATSIEVGPRTDWTRGAAVKRIAASSNRGPMGLFYAGSGGDDDDALAMTKALGGIAVAVGEGAPEGADLVLEDTTELLSLLQGVLVSLCRDKYIIW